MYREKGQSWVPVFLTMVNTKLVGGFKHVFFHSVGNFILPTDEVIFFRGVGSTTNHPHSLAWFKGNKIHESPSRMLRYVNVGLISDGTCLRETYTGTVLGVQCPMCIHFYYC